jgi:hypothetical protein
MDEIESENEWSERDERLIHVMSLGKNQSAAAKEIGCSRGHVNDLWRKNPDFRKAVRKRAMDRLERDERLLASTQQEAIERLRLLVQSEDENVALKAIAIVVGKCAAISDGKLKSEIEEIKEWQTEQDSLGVAGNAP